MEPTYPINLTAIIVCGIIAIVLDVLYYSPMLLGKIWIASLEKSEEEIGKDINKFKVCSISFLAQIVMAYMLARIMSYIGASTPQEGIRTAFLVWIGFVATTMTINMVYEGKSFAQFLIDSGYHFIVLLIYGIILGAWH